MRSPPGRSTWEADGSTPDPGEPAPRPPLGVVLAGGASRRLGRDKATIEAGGETLAGRAARKLLAACAEVALADRGRGLLPGLPSLADGPGTGPAAGILGAAHVHPGRPLLVLACDLPEVPAALLAELAREPAHGRAADWCVPRWQEGIEPLCALYRPRALDALAAAVAAGDLAPHRLAAHPALAVRYLEGDALARFGDPRAMFLNLNDPADLAHWARGQAGS